jgi:uncharacterized protein (DUF169 family)
MEKILMEELRLYHHPVAVTWLFTDEEVEEFRAKNSCITPVKAITFCQWEIAARMQNKTVLAAKEQLGCSNAQVSFGFKENDDKEIKSQIKYCRDIDQAGRFQLSKPRLSPGSVRAVGVGPLGKSASLPHVVHFYCDNMQAYHLAVDYMAATDTHPLRPQITMSSSACGGSVFAWLEKTFNCCPACSGSYNSGKTERGEVNVFIPGGQIEAVVERLLQRIRESGSSAITRLGDSFPGGDICKNCPLIVFKADACENCEQ